MPPLNVRVRLPGAKEPEEVSVQSELLVAGAISVIAKQLGAGNLTGAKLVVAPTGRKNGVIADSSSRLSELLFNPEEDILELWRSPQMMSVCIYFKEGINDNIRDRKIIPVDASAALLQMVPTLQRVLDLFNQPFSIQYAESIDTEGRVQRPRWLHCSTPLEDQNVNLEKGHLLCHPHAKLYKTPEQALNAITKGYMWKRSMKGDRISTKQRRLFVLSEAFLYYFKKEKDSSSAGVIPLDYYVVTRKIQPKKKKYALLLTLSNDSWKGMTTMYKLQAETPESLEHWVENIKQKCINAGNRRVFGIDIKEITARNSNQSRFIPNIIKECILFINENALTSEGIFRLSACTSTVEFYKEQYDSGQPVNFADALDNNVPAALLKCYLRELPEPLLTYNLYSRFEEAASISNDAPEKITVVGEIFAEMPSENYATSKFLFSFLSLVAQKEDENKMGSANLATVFGPNLLSSPEGSSVQAFGLINALTEFIIKSQKQIFETAEKKNPNLTSVEIPSLGENERQRSRSWASGSSRKPDDKQASIGIGIRERGRGVPRSRGSVPSMSVRKAAPPPPARTNPPSRGNPRGRPISVMNSNSKNISPNPSRPISVHPQAMSISSPNLPIPQASSTQPSQAQTLESLEKELEFERSERLKLQKQVEELSKRIQFLESQQN